MSRVAKVSGRVGAALTSARDLGRSTIDLRRRVALLEREVQELRGLSVRLAELTDVVEQLLLPVESRNEERLAELLTQYRREFH
jgi:hypothetical protein